MLMLRNCYRKNLELVIDRSTKLANSALNHIRLRHDQTESSIASSTFFAAEHLSTLDASAAICTRSSLSICPILNLVTRMPVMMASLCFAFLANFLSSPYYTSPSFTAKPLPGSQGMSNSLCYVGLSTANYNIYNDYMISLPRPARVGGCAVG